LDVYGLQGDEIFWAKVYPKDIEVEPRSDYDGETRMLGVEINLCVELQIYREESCEVLKDAYSLDVDLELERENASYYQLLVKNISKVRLMEQQQMGPNQKRILQICGSSGAISLDTVERGENGIRVEGVLNVHILYATAEDALPFAHVESHLPFEQFVEIQDFSENAKVWLEYKLEQMQVNLLDGTEYEIKAVIEIGVLALEEKMVSNIIEVKEEALDMDFLQRSPGMIGYLKKDGEDLWDVAKKYHVAPANIIENGNRVLVVKQVY
jgi:hypothetical protein